MSLMGFMWKDLQITTKDTQTALEGLRMQFLTGYDTNSLAAAGLTYTVVDSGFFDIFIAPDPPLNVRILGYGPTGYRIEWEPLPIF
jgi:hypothetical protein